MAEQNLSLGLRIRLDAGNAASGIRNVTGEISQLGRATDNASIISGRFSQQIGGLRVGLSAFGIAGAASAAGIAALGHEIYATNAQFQSLRASLTSVTGTAEKSQLAFSFIQDFAAQTPFDVAQVTESFIKLGNLGLKPSEEALRSYGNTASAMGKDMSQMIEAVADASTFEFERLKEFGIKSKQEGDNVQFTFNGMTTTVAKNASEIEGYLVKLGNTKFGTAMALQAQTMNGAMSNLGDTWDVFIDHILDTNKENAIASWVKTASDSLHWLDVGINGAITNKDKLDELNRRIQANQSSLFMHDNNGALGSFVDFVSGYRIAPHKQELEADKKARADLIAQMEQEKNKQNELITSMGKAGSAATSAATATKTLHKQDTDLLKNTADLQKTLTDERIADVKRLTDATISSFDAQKTANDNLYADYKISAQSHYEQEIALIDKTTAAKISALQQQSAAQSVATGSQLTDLDRLHAAILQHESRGDLTAVNWNPKTQTTSGALGGMQVLPSTLRDAGYGVAPFQPAIDQNITNKTPFATLKAFATQFQNELKNYGEVYFDGLVKNLGSVDAAIQQYGDHTKAYKADIYRLYGDINGAAADSVKIASQQKDIEAQKNQIIAEGAKQREAAYRAFAKDNDAYQKSVAELNIKYLQLTGNTTQAAIETAKLAQSTDTLRQQALTLGDKDALAYFEAIQNIDPNLAPLQEQISHFGMLDFEITRATEAQLLLNRAIANPQDFGTIDTLIKKTHDLGTAQYEAFGQSQFADITKQFDNGASEYAAAIDKANAAFDYAQANGFDTKYIVQYQQKIKQEFELASPAGQASQEFFNALNETSTQVFTALVNNSGNAVEAMLSSFKGFFSTVTASFIKLGQNSFFDFLQNGVMKEGGWLNVAVAGLSIGASLLPSLFNKTAAPQTASPAQAYQSGEVGAGAMAIVDSIARDTGFNFASKTAAIFNQNMQSFSRLVTNNARAIFSGIGSLGKELMNTQSFAWLGKGLSFISNGFQSINSFADDAIKTVSSWLGFSSAAEKVADATINITGSLNEAANVANTASAQTTVAAGVGSKFLSGALSVIGAVYSVYDYITNIGNILDNGTVGQAVGSTISMIGGLTSLAGVLMGFNPLIGLAVGVVGFLISLFSSPKTPQLSLKSVGNYAGKMDGIQSQAYPESGGGIISATSGLGLIQIASHYKGGVQEDALRNATESIMSTMIETDAILVKAFVDIEGGLTKTSKSIAFAKANLNQYVAQDLNGADLSQMIEQRYGKIADLIGWQGTQAGIVFNKVYDLMLAKFKAVDDKSIASLGIAQQVAKNLGAFVDYAPFLDLLGKIEGVGINRTAEQVMNDWAGALYAIGTLRDTLATVGDFSNDAINAMLDTNTSIEIVATNMAQFVIALKNVNANIDEKGVLAEINKIKATTASFSEKQQQAFFATFGTLSSLFSETGLTSNVSDLSVFSGQIMDMANASTQAANTAIDYAIAENHLSGVTRDSEIQTLLRTKAIDEATATESDYLLAVQKVTKEVLDGVGFIQSFAVSVGLSMSDIGTSADKLFNAGKNVVAVFGDMDKASAFFDRTAKSFLSPEQQATVAARIADNNVASLLAANASLSSISVRSIQDMLLKGTGLADFISAFAQGNGEQATAITTYIDALGAQLTANNALTDSFGNMKTVANDVQKYLDSLKLNSELTTLNPAQRLAESHQQFTTTLASANAGNDAAANNLTSVADNYLKEARSFFASSPEYSAIMSAVMGALTAFITPVDSKKAVKPMIDGSNRNGLDYVPFDGYISELHQGERVQTKEQARRDDSKNNDAELRELKQLIKEQNDLIKQHIRVSRYGFEGVIEAEGKVAESLDGIEQQIWKQATA